MALDGPLAHRLSLAVLVVAAVASLLVVVRLSDRRLLAPVRRRLLLGFPVGTALTVVGLYVVFYVVQGAARGDPIVVGFRSWSYSYPLGMVVAPFAHGNLGHLTGNVLSTVVFAPIAEYAWSHYPTRRGSAAFSSARTNPFVRVGGFLVGVVLVGLVTSLFIPGALIGFSGVVFAFAGFALVTRPLLAVGGIVSVRVVSLAYSSLQDPVVTARAVTRVVRPFWANVAVQGHAMGLLVGALAGLVLVARREEPPSPVRVWFATLVFAVSETLYAIYTPLGTDVFVLFRGLGLGVMFALAAVVAVAAVRADRSLVPRSDLDRRQLALGLLLAGVLAIGLAAVPYNLVDVDGETEGGVEVRDYTVTYVEGTPNEYVAAVEIPLVGNPLSVNESGVVVTSDRRNAWEVVVPRSNLALNGRASVPVGGLGWRETVFVNRTTWSVVDAGATYKVYLDGPGGPRQLAFRADPVAVPAVVNDTRLRIGPTDESYAVQALRNGSTVDTVAVPTAGRNVTLADITLNRTGDELRAIHEGTRLRIARFKLDDRPDR
jgi:membrane associated rhomboid family serine protease